MAKRQKSYSERIWKSADGLTHYARDYESSQGDAKHRLPVICLHGLTRNSKDFGAIAPVIARLGRRVIVPDIRGRGRSEYDQRPENYTPKTYARDISELMGQLGISRAVFLGTSMGGIITLALSAVRRDLISAVILNDVGPEIDPIGVARIKSYAGKPVKIDNWDDAVHYIRRLNTTAFPALTDQGWIDLAQQTFRDVGGTPMMDYDPSIMIPLSKPVGKIQQWLAWLMFRRLGKNRPMLLLRGALSDLLTPRISERMRRLCPNLTYAEIPDVGHAPLLTETEAIGAIVAFLQRVD